ncbi:MAG: S46 family peptidase [Ignavibacteria bacterium]|nr:S46 family peptidase [Ignavibacteria bacterium]
MRKKLFSVWYLVIVIVTFSYFGCSTSKLVTSTEGYENVKAGKFDTGKMWTFDFPPLEYFKSEYGFNPTKEWFEKARLAAPRFGGGCSSSFVSEDGLLMTNHHCARGALDRVNKEGEALADSGFYAMRLEDERKVPNLAIDQLILIEDVTDEVKAAFESGKTDEEKVNARRAKIQEIENRYNEKTKLMCNVVTFFNGGKYSLYGYKRYTDVRLVFAPETIVAYYGGDYDNFTYPRYDFYVAFFRVYDEDGKPLKTPNYFKWSNNGAGEGDVIFVVGNPGRTSRLLTVSQLEFLRDYSFPTSVDLLNNLVRIYSDFIEKNPDKRLKYQSQLFGIANSQKANTGYWDGLKDKYLMAKKRDFENTFKSKVMANPQLKSKYGSLWDEIAEIQEEKAEIFAKNYVLGFRGMGRAVYFQIASSLVEYANQMKLPEDKRMPRYKGKALDSLKMRIVPADLEHSIQKEILAYQLESMKKAYGNENDAINKLVGNKPAKLVAEDLVNSTIVCDKEKVNALLNGNPDEILNSKDPFISFIVKIENEANEISKKYSDLQAKESAKVQPLGNALFDIYGTSIPPDATSSLRISDGVVKGYEYNGTIAPPITTFYGMYDRYYSFGKKGDFNLPDRWVNHSSRFDLSTPFNFVSTADIIGGNSGSALVNKNLELVGLAFDGNIESLAGLFIFDETKNRTVAVHSAGLLEGLEDLYYAERLVKELKSGKMEK